MNKWKIEVFVFGFQLKIERTGDVWASRFKDGYFSS